MATRSASSFGRAERPFALFAAAFAAALFVLSWILLHEGFYARDQLVDTPVYQNYGELMADGKVPYRDFDVEYPPAALPVFAIPSLVTTQGDGEEYRRVFEAAMVVCGLLAVLLVAGVLGGIGSTAVHVAGALSFVALAPLALGSVVLTRYDLWPAALTVGALAALAAGRERLGAGVLALAVAAKFYPAALVPLVGIWIFRRAGRRRALVAGGIFVAVLAAAFLPFAIVAPDGLGWSIDRQLSRPLQVESLGAASLVVLHHVAGLGVSLETGFGSQNLGGPAADAVGLASTVAQAALLVALWIAFARGPMERRRLLRYAAAAVVALVAFGKVLSPQFVIWLVPLVPLVAGRRGLVASLLLGAALVLTQVWFPFRYWDYAVSFDEAMSWVVLARDLVLVAVLAVLVWPVLGASRPRP